jgi:hypothetical protein
MRSEYRRIETREASTGGFALIRMVWMAHSCGYGKTGPLISTPAFSIPLSTDGVSAVSFVMVGIETISCTECNTLPIEH